MAEYYVEHRGWTHWPKVLLMCRKHGDGVERRRYVPDRGECRDSNPDGFDFFCDVCGGNYTNGLPNYCPSCGRKVAKAPTPF